MLMMYIMLWVLARYSDTWKTGLQLTGLALRFLLHLGKAGLIQLSRDRGTILPNNMIQPELAGKESGV